MGSNNTQKPSEKSRRQKIGRKTRKIENSNKYGRS